MLKKATVVLLFVVFASHNLIAQKWSLEPDGYFQVSMGIRLGSEEPMDYYYDWTLGCDLGIGMQFGPFHAGIGGGIRIQAVEMLLGLIFGEEEDPPQYPGQVEDPERQSYADFPVRCYFGLDVERLRIDAFLGRYYRVGNHSEAPPEQNFEAGIAFAAGDVFLETSYIWPQKNLVRISIGLQADLKDLLAL
jgi:hypothetical protein